MPVSPRRAGLVQAAAVALASRALARATPDASRAARSEAASPRHDHGGGRGAQAPQENPARGWKEIAWRVHEEAGRDRVLAVAAGVAFYGLLALFPMIAAFVSLYGLFADPSAINQHLATMGDVLPGGAVEVIGDQVGRIASQPRGRLGFSFAAGLAVSLWSANAGVKAIFDALNVAYGEEEKRSFVALNLESLAFTLGAILALGVALAAMVGVPALLKMVALGESAAWALSLARWPLLLALVALGLAALYRYGPSRANAKWRWLSPGAALASLVWLAASVAFSWYAAHFGSYNETYGSLGAVVGFMTWMWISATIVLVGAELNAETERQTARDTMRGASKPMGARGAAMADQVAPQKP
jgi:membrane protein